LSIFVVQVRREAVTKAVLLLAERQYLAIGGHDLARDQRIARDAQRPYVEADPSAQQEPRGADSGAASVRDGGIVRL
jgi:hypothetical protein